MLFTTIMMKIHCPPDDIFLIISSNFMVLNFLFCSLLAYCPVEGALAHPYLASLHDISDEPVCSMPFSFDFEQHALSEEQMKDLIYQEALAFNPEYQ